MPPINNNLQPADVTPFNDEDIIANYVLDIDTITEYQMPSDEHEESFTTTTIPSMVRITNNTGSDNTITNLKNNIELDTISDEKLFSIISLHHYQIEQ